MVTQEQWLTRNVGSYKFYEPIGGMGQKQGWKIHVSFTPRDYEWVVEEIKQVCAASSVAFKVARDRDAMMAILGKGGSRISAGKLAAIYAGNADRCEELIHELEERLFGLEGPEVLTDLRVSEAPIFVRYGAFLEMFTRGEDGFQTPAFELPSGERVPDKRGVRFDTPDGVEQPEFIETWLRRKKETGTEVRAAGVNVDSVLMYSTGGGVYTGKYAGETVLVKEARRLVGYDENGADAVDRLRQEFAAHRALQNVDTIPKAIALRPGRNHLFMIREFVEGEQLFSKAPVMRAALDFDMYNRWCDSVVGQSEHTLEEIWDAGWSMNDVQPRNFIITPGNSVSLVDLECARPQSLAGEEKLIHTLEFTPDPSVFGVQRDRNGLAAVRVWMSLGFVPPITGRTVRFLRAAAQKQINASEKLAEAFDQLEAAGKANDVSASGSASVVKSDSEALTVRDSDEPMIDVSGSKLEQFAVEAVVAGVTERSAELDEVDYGFWTGVTGAVSVTPIRLGPDGRSHDTMPYPWDDDLAEFVSENSDSKMLDGALSSYALSAAISGASFPWESWVPIVKKSVELEELNRGLYSGLSGIMLVCNQLGPAGGETIIELAEITYRKILENIAGDVDWSLLYGRAGAGLALLAAHRVFDLGERADGLELLKSASKVAAKDESVFRRGGLQGWFGLLAAARAATADDDELRSLELEVPDVQFWANLRHRSLGLDGVGGSLIAADTLLDDAEWVRGPMLEAAAQRLSIVFSGEEPFNVMSDPRVSYGLSTGVAGFVAGAQMGRDIWKDWFKLGRD